MTDRVSDEEAKRAERILTAIHGSQRVVAVNIPNAAFVLDVVCRLLAERAELEAKLAEARRGFASEALDKANEITSPDTYADRYAALCLWLRREAGREGAP